MKPGPPVRHPHPDTTRHFLQVIFFVLFATVGVYWLMLEYVAPSSSGEDVGSLAVGFQGITLVTAAAVLFLRFRQIPASAQEADPKLRLGRVRALYIVCFILSETVALYGFVLRILGESRESVAPFFLGAGALFLLCYPRLPSDRGEPVV